VLEGRLPESADPTIAERWADTVLRLRDENLSG
jgi:hypothetical protein